MNSDITQGSAVTATIESGGLVTLYAPDNEAILVPADRVGLWLRRGFTRTAFDLDASETETLALMDAARAALVEYVAGVRADGLVDPSDVAAKAAAELAFTAFETAWNRLHRGIEEAYPVKEQPSVAVTRIADDGAVQRLDIDPSQLPLYVQAGWEAL